MQTTPLGSTIEKGRLRAVFFYGEAEIEGVEPV